MDMCFSRVRFAALETVVDAFKSTKVKVLYVASVLGFLVKLEGQAGSQGQPAVVSQDSAVDVDVHSVKGGIMLPGCAKTIHIGKHPAQVGTTYQALYCIAEYSASLHFAAQFAFPYQCSDGISSNLW